MNYEVFKHTYNKFKCFYHAHKYNNKLLKDDNKMINKYKFDNEKLINEIIHRVNNKNYLLKESYIDSIDYIAARVRKELSNYWTLKSTLSIDQRATTKCFVRTINERKIYPLFKNMINSISCDIERFNIKQYKYLSDDEINELSYNKYEEYDKNTPMKLNKRKVKVINYMVKNNYFNFNDYVKSKEESQVKYYSRLISDKNFYFAISMLNVINTPYDLDLRYFYKIYKECEKIVNDNIKKDNEFIRNILNKAITNNDNIDWSKSDKEIVKYINNIITWRFLDERKLLHGYIRPTRRSLNSKTLNRHNHICEKWFGFPLPFNSIIIEEYKHLNKNQKKFVIEVLDNRFKLFEKNNKQGQVDLSKKEMSNILGISIKSFDNKLRRIRESNIKHGVIVDKYKNIYIKLETSDNANLLDPKLALSEMYITEEEKAIYTNILKNQEDEYYNEPDIEEYEEYEEDEKDIYYCNSDNQDYISENYYYDECYNEDEY